MVANKLFRFPGAENCLVESLVKISCNAMGLLINTIGVNFGLTHKVNISPYRLAQSSINGSGDKIHCIIWMKVGVFTVFGSFMSVFKIWKYFLLGIEGGRRKKKVSMYSKRNRNSTSIT